MSIVLEYLQLGCAFCRISIYTLFRRLCCRSPPPPRPEISVVCIGLAKAGKSTLLALISGESTQDIQPTIGFSIKALQFKNCILNVKEIGGGEGVRPYWKHYFSGAKGIIFVLDSACPESDLEIVKTELSNALANPTLDKLPLLVLACHQEKDGARSIEQLKKELELEFHGEGRAWLIHPCSLNDLRGIKEGFENFNQYLLGEKSVEGDQTPREQGQSEDIPGRI
ncbi:ADP-ribosylation factor-like protein 15 [Lingula anatina]|uniref:ADP-ribosylation factor-like protein 15 n=1 Tax=Lingula anatina TaxID=7574 RepID=A0A1S3K6H9_LINAN|nr:ADP-ribosylation factor-like protein 15 [Lingula anatina]|eukprot:XP_013418107.1 ADP-ribosylation factor-like protein 15 [Lingula anatina]